MDMAKLKRSITLATLFGVLLFSHAFGATNRDVCESGCTFSSIQAALDAAEDGDTVRVAQGLYFENDIRIDDPITVTIQGGWNTSFTSRSSDPRLTIIDGMGLDRVFYIYASYDETISVTIEGLTITNGKRGDGGGIYARARAGTSSTTDSILNLTLTNNRIVANQAFYWGGGIYVSASTSSDVGSALVDFNLNNNRIAHNSACSDGGGLVINGYSNSSYSRNSLLRFNIIDNEINGNTANNDGGGVYIILDRTDYEEGGSGSMIKRNDINGNWAWDDAGGLYLDLDECSSSTLPIINNVISGNYASTTWDAGGARINSDDANPVINFYNNTITNNTGYGLEVDADGSGGVPDNFVLNLSNNIIYGNQVASSGSDDVDLDNQSDGNMVVNSSNNSIGQLYEDVTYNDNGGNLTTDPLMGDDFHIRSGSPAINSANAALAPATDKDGNARVGAPDRGAYEYLGSDHASELPLPDSRYELEYRSMPRPIVASDPVVARPFTAFIDATNTLKLRIDLPKFSSNVDLYVGLFIPRLDPNNLYQIASDLTLQVSVNPIKFRSNLSTAVTSSLWGDLDTTGWPRMEGFVYLIAVPEGYPFFGTTYYSYQTSFIVE